MDKVLVTGCAGLLGSHISKKYADSGYEVIGLDSLIGGYFTNISDNIHFYEVDILNHEEIKYIFEEHKPKLVIHCAALPHEGLSVFTPAKVVTNIVGGTVSVASAGIANGMELFVNFSSMARYGAEAYNEERLGPPFSEDMVCKPVDPYGLAKLNAEQHLDLLTDIYGFKTFTVIPHNVCGPNQVYSDPYRNVVSIFANRLLNGNPVYIYGDGEQKRSFSHVDDCVEAVVHLVNESKMINSGAKFNIGPDDGSEITINQLAKIVASYCQTELDVINIPDRPREVKNAWVSTTRAKSMLQYETTKTVEETVRDTVSWIKSQPKREFNYHLDLEIVNDSTPKTWKDKLFN